LISLFNRGLRILKREKKNLSRDGHGKRLKNDSKRTIRRQCYFTIENRNFDFLFSVIHLSNWVKKLNLTKKSIYKDFFPPKNKSKKQIYLEFSKKLAISSRNHF
jgi:hypothetical protein